MLRYVLVAALLCMLQSFCSASSPLHNGGTGILRTSPLGQCNEMPMYNCVGSLGTCSANLSETSVCTGGKKEFCHEIDHINLCGPAVNFFDVYNNTCTPGSDDDVPGTGCGDYNGLVCTAAGKCQLQSQSAMGWCTTNDECASGHCFQRRCLGLAAGQQCSSNNACAHNTYCLSGQCTARVPVGGTCSPGACALGSLCHNGVCTALLTQPNGASVTSPFLCKTGFSEFSQATLNYVCQDLQLTFDGKPCNVTRPGLTCYCSKEAAADNSLGFFVANARANIARASQAVVDCLTTTGSGNVDTLHSMGFGSKAYFECAAVIADYSCATSPPVTPLKQFTEHVPACAWKYFSSNFGTSTCPTSLYNCENVPGIPGTPPFACQPLPSP